MVERKNHYQVLQVDPAAEPEIIAAAYKKLALKYHPDVNKTPESNRAMQRINLAYQILSDPVERARYDKELQQIRESPKTPAQNEAEDVPPAQEYSIPKYQPKYPFYQANPSHTQRDEQDFEWLKRERRKAAQSRSYSEPYKKYQTHKNIASTLKLGWIIAYILITLFLFLIFGSQAKSTEGVVVILIIGLIASIPIVWKLDDILRK